MTAATEPAATLPRSSRVPSPRLLAILAVSIGWLGLYFAFRQMWVGIGLALTATVLAIAAVRIRELDRLHHLAAVLLAGADVSGLVGEVAEAAVELLQAQSGGVTLVVQEGGFLKVAAAIGTLADTVGRLIPVDESLLGSVVTGGAPLLSNDMDADPRAYRMPGLSVALHAVAIVPLRSAGVVIGTISVYNRRDGRRFTDHDLQLLETLGDQVVVGLDRNAVLEESAATSGRWRRRTPSCSAPPGSRASSSPT